VPTFYSLLDQWGMQLKGFMGRFIKSEPESEPVLGK